MCRCECKEFINKGRCDDGFIWNLSPWQYECNKSCNVGEYLDFTILQCRERLIDKLVIECNENIDGNEMVYNATLHNYGKVCKSCTLHIVLLIITCIIVMGISGTSFYFCWHTIKNCFNTLSYWWLKKDLWFFKIAIRFYV